MTKQSATIDHLSGGRLELGLPVGDAVIDAMAPYGVRHIDMPFNGERIWRAIQDAADHASG